MPAMNPLDPTTAAAADDTASGVLVLGTEREPAAEKINDANGEVAAAVNIAGDIPERRRAEEPAREREREQRVLAAQFEDERAQLIAAQAVAKVGSWETDLCTMAVKWSAETYRIFEVPAGQAPTHQAFLQLVHPEERARVDEAFVRSLEQCEVSVIEHRLLLPGGRIKFVAERWQAFKDDAGRPIRVLGTCQDITERKEAEETLREQTALLSNAQRIGRMGSWSLDLRSGRLVWPDVTCDLFGVSPAEFPGTFEYFYSLILPEDLPTYDAADSGVSSSAPLFEAEYRIRRPDGAVRWMHSRGRAEVDAKGTPIGRVGMVMDITEERAAREQLAQNAALLRIAGKAARLGGWTIQLPDRKLTWSDENCAIHDVPPGYQPTLEEGLGYYPPEYRAEVVRRVDACATEGTPYDFELPIITAKGRRVWVRSIGEAVRDERGRIIRMQGAFQDISERRRADDALRESEERLRAIFEASRDGILVEDDEVIVYINESYTRMLGYEASEKLVGRHITEMLPADDAERLTEYGHARLRGETPPTIYEFKGKRKDGSLIDLEAAVSTSVIAGKRYVTTAVRDITERKEAEGALRASESELRALAESMPQMVWMTRPDGWNIYFNQRWVDYTGLTLEESYGHGWKWPFHPDDRQRASEAWQKAMAGLADYSLECRLRGADGNYRWMLVRGEPFRDPAGRITKWMGTCTDIDDLKHAEVLLREQASLLDQAHDAIVVRGLDDRITFWSDGAERLYGWCATDVLGRRFDELLRIDAGVFEAAKKAALTAGIWNGEVVNTTSSGQAVVVDASWTLLRDDEGQPKAMFSIETDITGRKSLEKQFLRAQRLESLGTLAGGIAHDLNNLLAPILMGVTLLKRLQPGERSLQAINNIERSVKRGTNLVKQVLLFARGVEGNRTAVDLRKIVAEVEAIAESAFPKDIAFVTTMPERLDKVLGDATQLNQVLLNLCVNARDAMPGGGRITVSAEELEVDDPNAATHGGSSARRYVVLQVADNGSGIPKEIMERIFEPFFTTKELGQGTGLGLSTVQGIVRSHGGFIEVTSEAGRGSVFRVHLPAHSDVSAATGVEGESGHLPRGNGEVILVVDDEPSILDITRQTLEEFGYAVLTAEDGAHAIGIYAGNDNIALVLTDMMMPVMDGVALIAALRRINPAVPIIVASGHTEPEQLARITRTGGIRFLAKPYSAEVMLRTLFQLLRSVSVPAA